MHFGNQLSPRDMRWVKELIDEDNIREMLESGDIVLDGERVPITADNNPLLMLWSIVAGQDFLGKDLFARGEATSLYSWAVPTAVAINKIAEFQPIIEMGAGLGFWAYLLRQLGVRVDAFDGFEEGGFGYSPEDTWSEVLLGGPEKLAEYPPEWSLLLVWPPYSKSFGTDCLIQCNSDFVITVGEGSGGCNGDDWYHMVLDEAFERIDSIVDFPQWDGIHDELVVHKRIISPDDLVEHLNEKWRDQKFRHKAEGWSPYGFPEKILERNGGLRERNLAVGRLDP